MDAAAMAAMSDPARNFHFSRRWSDGPPLERISPRMTAIIQGPDYKDVSSELINSYTNRLLQAAFRLDRLADQEIAIGRVKAAERLAHAAQALRECMI